MKPLTRREEQIMQIVWELGKAFIRDVVDKLPEPKPHYNTVATLVTNLVKKGFLVGEKLGNTYCYTPTDKFKDYRENHLQEIKQKFFGNSLPKMLAYFAKDEKLSEEDINELMDIIKSKKQ